MGCEASEAGAVGAFLAGKAVLLTGGSGFVGRVLLERLLRTVPDGGDIFLLLRPRRGADPQQRLGDLTSVSLFDGVRSALGRLRAVAGDCAQPGLGLSEADRAMLAARVAVVVHCAASVRFDLPLRTALLLNVRATRDLCDLAAEMPLLQAFVHVSTAYANCDRSAIDEQLYPPPGDWRTYLFFAENPHMDAFPFDAVTSKILGNHPNTYVFTKALAEQVVNDYYPRLPVGIIRPSVVAPTDQDPFPGWIDNFNGPTSLMFGVRMGILHEILYDYKKYLDVIPVDKVVSGIMLTILRLGATRNFQFLPVFNATFGTNKHLADVKKLYINCWLYQAENTVPSVYKAYVYVVKSEFIYWFLFMFLDLPIAFVVDSIAGFAKEKKRMVKIYRRVFVAQLKVAFFCVRTFNFTNNNFLSLRNDLHPKEKESYLLSSELVHLEPFLIISGSGLGKLIFKNHSVKSGRQAFMFAILHYTICAILLGVLWKSEFIKMFTLFSVNLSRFFLGI